MENCKITVSIGDKSIGPGHPILIQSMCNVSTMDTQVCVDQCVRIFDEGGGLVRLAARNIEEARNLKIIREELNKRGYNQPIAADVHFNPAIASIAAGEVEKVRINPGNFADEDAESQFREFLEVCKINHTAIRIGVNHGSLSERIMEKYGDTPEGMVESAMEYLRMCKRQNFSRLVVSLKSSNTRIMVYANRLLKRRMVEEGLEYPLHIGVTEAGSGEEGRIRSAAGIGTLLIDGIGDTIRVSLTEDPVTEIPVAQKLIDAAQDVYVAPSEVIAYEKRESEKTAILGGGQQPIVIEDISAVDQLLDSGGNKEPQPADYLFVPDHMLFGKLPAGRKFIVNYEAWMQDRYPEENFFPLFELKDFLSRKKASPVLNFIEIRPDEAVLALNNLKETEIPCCIVYVHNSDPCSRDVFIKFAKNIRYPLVVQADYNDIDHEMFQILSATQLSWYFIDGYADGLWLDNPFAGRPIPRLTAFKILQACRARMTETDYIACPSCGRTLFNIQERLSEVKKATSGLTHLKIAVMGCIVNGPGEMADADYGYVGSGKGRVSIYMGKKEMLRNIAEENALEELVKLIKKNDDWKD